MNYMTASISDIVEEINLLFLEEKVAKAAVLLFYLNKQRRDLWVQLKIYLLQSVVGHNQLFQMASIIDVAEKTHLSQSFHLVPGLHLSVFSNQND